MQFIATQKYFRMSPRKLRLAVDMIKHLSPAKAVDVLPLMSKRAALPVQKVIKSAIANAKQKGIADSDLSFLEIQIGQGPRLKRYRAGSRGRYKPYTHDMSHIRVVLTDEKKVKKGQKVKEVEAVVEEVKEIKPVKKAKISLPKRKKKGTEK